MKPLILITNDDGIFSPGLAAAAEAVATLGELLIAAPHQQQTGMSRALMSSADTGKIEDVTLNILGKPYPAYAVHATPALTVAHAVVEIASRLPDLCISGINYGENIGAMLPVSGTISAAFEASTSNIPAIAVSRGAELRHHRANNYAELDWQSAVYFTHIIAEQVLQKGLPPDVAVLNINIPDDATPETEIRITTQSQQAYYYFRNGGKRDFSQPHMLDIEFNVNAETLQPESDIQAFVYDRVVSVTPLTRNLTANTNLNTWYETLLHD